MVTPRALPPGGLLTRHLGFLESLRAAGYDAVLLPTTANLPPKLDRLLADPAHFVAENLLALRNPNLANLLRLCALTIPTGIPSCGVMALAPPGAEARLLRLGAAMERAIS